MSQFDWSRAPDDALSYGYAGACQNPVWVGDGWYEYVSSGRRFSFAAQEGFSTKEIRITNTRTLLKVWDGEGLPPAGLVLEYMWSYKPEGSEYVQVEILVHDKGSAVMRTLDGPDPGVLRESRGGYCGPGNGQPIFRLIRTPEQIAADERAKECDSMYGIILDSVPEDRRRNGSDIVEALYDAGCRLPK